MGNSLKQQNRYCFHVEEARPPRETLPMQQRAPCRAMDFDLHVRMQFDHSQYWEDRYKNGDGGATYEWYRGYTSIEPVITRHVARDARILHVGCGTSSVQVDMLLDGYQSITNVDYSKVCIAIMAERHKAWVGEGKLQYSVADCRSMPQFVDSSFHAVLDKGCLDAMLCADDDTGNASLMLTECARVLCHGGVYIWVTSGSPQSRLHYLDLFGPSRVCVYELGQQGMFEGPLEASEASSAFPSMPYSHFAYVVKKKACTGSSSEDDAAPKQG